MCARVCILRARNRTWGNRLFRNSRTPRGIGFRIYMPRECFSSAYIQSAEPICMRKHVCVNVCVYMDIYCSICVFRGPGKRHISLCWRPRRTYTYDYCCDERCFTNWIGDEFVSESFRLSRGKNSETNRPRCIVLRVQSNVGLHCVPVYRDVARGTSSPLIA